jgi:glutamate synthase domain-containing protein 2
MFEIKMSQGAKPGKGGMLPGLKVTEEIARIRGIEVGCDSISPNGHEDIRSVHDLLDLQRGLVPEDKAERVANYATELEYSIGLVAHSCGVLQPRDLDRHHVRIIGHSGQSKSLSAIHPTTEVKSEYIRTKEIAD